MKTKYKVYLNNEERSLVINSLITWKSDLQKQGRYTDAIDDLLVKVIKAPLRKVKIK